MIIPWASLLKSSVILLSKKRSHLTRCIKPIIANLLISSGAVCSALLFKVFNKCILGCFRYLLLFREIVYSARASTESFSLIARNGASSPQIAASIKGIPLDFFQPPSTPYNPQ